MDILLAAVDAQCGVCVIDGYGRIVHANEAFAKAVTQTVSALQGRTLDDLLDNEQPLGSIDQIWAVLATGTTWRGRLKFQTAEGAAYSANTTIVPRTGAGPEDMRYVMVQSNPNDVADLEAQLAVANDALSDMAKIQSNFLAAMSHDLRTPLNSIIGFTDIINEGLFGSIENERYAGYLESVNSSAKHLLTLVNDILDFSIMEATGYKFQLERFDPIEKTKNVVRTFDWISREKSLRIEVRGGARAPATVLADPRVAMQIQTNLITNACRHSPNGGLVTVVWDREEAGDVFLEIRNEGDPIPDEIIKGFGRPFLVRNPMHASNTEKSYGLGLYICHRFIEARGGTLTISRNNGVGARVRASWPESVLKPEPA